MSEGAKFGSSPGICFGYVGDEEKIGEGGGVVGGGFVETGEEGFPAGGRRGGEDDVVCGDLEVVYINHPSRQFSHGGMKYLRCGHDLTMCRSDPNDTS